MKNAYFFLIFAICIKQSILQQQIDSSITQKISSSITINNYSLYTSLSEPHLSIYKSNIDNLDNIKNKNFVVQENPKISYHQAYSSLDYYGKNCNTNLPIQLSLVISDKLKTKETVSPMTIIKCFIPSAEYPDKYTCAKKYDFIDEILTDVKDIFKQINNYENPGYYGLMYITTPGFEYKVDQKTGEFGQCTQYKNEIPFFEGSNVNLLEYYTYDPNDTKDLESIKKILYTTGSMIGIYRAQRSFLTRYINKSGPYVKDQSDYVGYTALRIIGWRNLNGADYWVFSYTKEKTFGMLNYGMINMHDDSLFLIDIIPKE